MKNLILIVFLFMVSIIAGCGGGGSEAPGDGGEVSANFSEYYPLTKGTFRTYRITEPNVGTTMRTRVWTSGATYSDQTSVRSCESSLSWEDVANVAGKTLGFAFSGQEDGLATLDKPYVIGIDKWKPGQTVSTTGTVSLDEFFFPLMTDVTFIGIESVGGPAGTFSDSMKINITFSTGGIPIISSTDWYAHGVGLVKSIDSDDEIWELTEYGTLPSPEPTLLNIDPPSGNINGSNLVTLTGQNFQPGASVSFGEKLASSVVFQDSTSLMAVTPPGTMGSNDVAVVNPDCQADRLEKGFKYEDGSIPPPPVATWMTEIVDDPKFFIDFSPQAIALDAGGLPHIIYGGDHLYHAYHDGSDWQYETVDGSPKVGRFAAIAIDSSGNAHASYLDESQDMIKYATNASGKWMSEAIDEASIPIDGGTSIAIDSSGTAHIVYGTTLGIKYANNLANQWSVLTVDSGSLSVSQSGAISIAIDNSENIHISYFFDSNSSLKHATNASGAWVAETVDDDFNAFAGESNAIAIDSMGNIHISYYYVDFSTHISEIRHATNTSGSWVAESVFSAGENGSVIKTTSIALDSSDNVHIGYWDWNAGVITYATNSSGSWIHEAVDPIFGQSISLAVDFTGIAHISYYDSFDRTLKYATNDSSTWVTQILDNSAEQDAPVGLYTSIAVDKADKSHVSYFDGSIDPFFGSLKYATNVSGTWKSEIVDLAGGKDTSVALDSEGNVHISYGGAAGLMYATNASGVWVVEQVLANPEAGNYTSIAVDSSNKVHIGFYDDNPFSGGLGYATNASGLWVIETVEGGWEVGKFSSITLDSSNKVHIAYSSSGGSFAVKYATNNSGSWVTETVDLHSGVFISIAVDSDGTAHISYYHGTFFGGLKYATNASGFWTTEVIDTGGDAGQYTSIVLDSLENVHISYYDSMNSDLRHATNAFCDWVIETVDADGAVGKYSSIGLDSLDNVRIGYFDEDNGSAKHATTLSIPKIGSCPPAQ